MSKTVWRGQTAEGSFRNKQDWTIHGVMTFPKFIPVYITFSTDGGRFGGWFYDRMVHQDFDQDLGERKVNLPLLQLWLSDRDEQKAELLYTMLRDAIVSGEKVAAVRFWKEEGEGKMTQLDRERGCSYESRYSILGMVTWPGLQAPGLPKWALPSDLTPFPSFPPT
jgi:hypothetical protein